MSDAAFGLSWMLCVGSLVALGCDGASASDAATGPTFTQGAGSSSAATGGSGGNGVGGSGSGATGGSEGSCRLGAPPLPGFPEIECVGWEHTGVRLEACEQYASGGNYVIEGSAAGTVVDGCDFQGNVRIAGGGAVTLKRSRVRAGGGDGSSGIAIDSGAGPVLIEDVEVTSIDREQEATRIDRTVIVAKDDAENVTLRRIYAHDGNRGLDVTGQENVAVEGSILAFNYNPPPSGDCGEERNHSTAIRAAGGVSNLTVRYTLLGVGECAFASGLVAFYPESGANHDVVFEGGLWVIQADNGGAYGIAVGYTPDAGESQNTNFTVKDVQISTEYYDSGCPSGCGQNWDQNPGSSTGPLGGTKIWENVTRYHPGEADHGMPIGP